MAFFDTMAIKANNAIKDINVTDINMKAGPPNRQTGLPLTSSFRTFI